MSLNFEHIGEHISDTLDQIDQFYSRHCNDDDNTDYTLSSARSTQSTSSVFCFYLFLSFAVDQLIEVVFVDCIHVVFCHPLRLVTGFNAIFNTV